MPRSRRRRRSCPVSGISISSSAAAISSSRVGSRGRPGHPGSAAARTTQGAGLPSGVHGATNVPTSVPNNPSRRANVIMAKCSAAPGGWAAAGTVHNPAGQPSAYRITVFFTTTSATVIGVATTSVSVPARSSKPWQAVGHFRAPAQALCVLRGVA